MHNYRILKVLTLVHLKAITIKKKMDGKFWRIGHIERNIPYNRDLGSINKIEDSSHTPL